MKHEPIQTEQGYREAMARLEQLSPAANPDSPEGEEFERLAASITEWEKGTGALLALLTIGESECRLGAVRAAKDVFAQIRTTPKDAS